MPNTVLSKRRVSPATPSFPFSTCLADAEHIYRQHGHNHFSRGEIASTLNLSATSGPFRQRLASLKMYGLLSPVGVGQFAITPIFEQIHFATEDSADYQEAAYQAITHPTTFKHILEQFPDHLPTTELLTKYLETHLSFTHKAAVRIVRVFQSSLNHIQVIDTKGNITPPDQPPSNTPQTPTPNNLNPEEILTLQIPVTDNHIVTIQYHQTLSPHDADKITRVLTALAS